MNRFLDLLQPLGDRIGPLNFQFEYLNKQKMSGVGEFIEKFGAFVAKLPVGFKYCIDILLILMLMGTNGCENLGLQHATPLNITYIIHLIESETLN